MCDIRGVAVQAQCQLGQVIRADRKPIEVLQKLFRQQGVGRNLTHHNHLEVVDSTFQAVCLEQRYDFFSFPNGPHERHHDPEIDQPHRIANVLQRPALQIKTVPKSGMQIPGSTPQAEHRVLFVGFELLSADQVGIFVGFEIGQADDDGIR